MSRKFTTMSVVIGEVRIDVRNEDVEIYSNSIYFGGRVFPNINKEDFLKCVELLYFGLIKSDNSSQHDVSSK